MALGFGFGQVPFPPFGFWALWNQESSSWSGFSKNKLIKSNSGSVLIPKIRPCSRTVLGNLDWNHWLIAGQPLVLVVSFPKNLGFWFHT
jgi:hypothetical protein